MTEKKETRLVWEVDGYRITAGPNGYALEQVHHDSLGEKSWRPVRCPFMEKTRPEGWEALCPVHAALFALTKSLNRNRIQLCDESHCP